MYYSVTTKSWTTKQTNNVYPENKQSKKHFFRSSKHDHALINDLEPFQYLFLSAVAIPTLFFLRCKQSELKFIEMFLYPFDDIQDLILSSFYLSLSLLVQAGGDLSISAPLAYSSNENAFTLLTDIHPISTSSISFMITTKSRQQQTKRNYKKKEN